MIGAVSIALTARATSRTTSVRAEDTGSPENRVAAESVSPHAEKSLGNVIRTDDRYGHDGLFQGPRGWVYWNFLENPKPIQNPNLWPDLQSTYFIGRFAMPAGSRMTLRGRFPYARFFQFALYKFERETFVSINETLRGPDFEPDPGSVNPFRVGADRLADQRDYTIHILAEDPPKDVGQRARNTLYVGRDEVDLEGVIRIYLADQDKDGAGWGPGDQSFAETGFPTYEATLADGTKLDSEQAVQRFGKPFSGATKQPMTTEQWLELVSSPNNDPTLPPETAPARNPPQWEKYWTNAYTLAGAFKPPAERAKIRYEGAMEGGGEGPYLVTYLSRKFGPVYVLRGKMPTFPDTFAGEDGRGLAIMPETQTQYWSLVSCQAVPSGQVVDGISDFQVPLDADRNYTIVVSASEDRPQNATPEHGVAWLKWSPRGEGLDDPRNRSDFGMLIMRIMANNSDWKQRPDLIIKPRTGSAVMGPYFPSAYYTTKAEFETNGARAQTGTTEESDMPEIAMTTGQGKTMTLTMQTLPESRGHQYCELVFNYGEKGSDIYSTSPLAKADLDWWENLDVEALAKEFGAESVYKNGPQWWSMDEVGVMASQPVPVAGVDMVFGAHLPPGTLKIAKYTVFSPAKFQDLVWKAGKPVYQLVDPDGYVYVLQGHKVPEKELAALGERFQKLPEGWAYRVQVLDEDLVMNLTPKEPIPSVQDEFDQIYIRIPE
ncbi:MAG: hypothetical protein DWQ41_21195 [Planctomycetota bacterium]|nr:MAG: hypothetical protein DWQ41_21195 [Planctomycetota bacterium]